MQVLTPDGYKDVATLGVGDEVIGRYNVNTIIELDHMEYDLADPEQQFLAYTINGTYTFFQEQLVLLNDVIQMRHARELVVGDVVIADGGSPITITSLTAAPATEWWHFTISDDRTFIADGLMLHNSTITCGAAGGVLTAGATWVGGVAPGAGDDAIIDATCTANVSLTASNWSVHGVDWTGYVNSFTCSTTRTWTVGGLATLTTASNLKFASGMTLSFTGTFTLTCDNRNASGITITTNAVSGLTGVDTLNMTSATTTDKTIFADNATFGATTMSLNRGSVTINSGVTLTSTGTFQAIGSAGTNTINCSGATFNFGSLLHSAAGALSVSGNSSTVITCGANDGSSHTWSTTGETWPGTVTVYGGPASLVSASNFLTGSSTFTNLFLVGQSTKFSCIGFQANQTITGEFKCTGNSQTNRLFLSSSVYGTARTMTVTGATTTNHTNTDFQDITSTGATTSGTSLGNCQGNSGITFTGAVTRYAVYGASGSQNWSAAKWSASSGGATGASQPLPQDTAVYDNSSASTNMTVTIDILNISAINASALSNHTLTIQNVGGLSAFQSFGDINLSSSVGWGGGGSFNGVSFQVRGTQNFTSNGATVNAGSTTFATQNIGGTLNFLDDFVWTTAIGSATFSIQYGTVNPQGNFSVPAIADSAGSTRALTFTAGKTLTLNSTGTIVNLTASLTLTTNNVNVAITDTGASSKTIIIAPTVSWGDVTITTGGAGAVIFNAASTYKSLNVTGGGTKSIQFSNGTTHTLTTAVFFRGAASNLITITSDSAGAAFTLACSAGYVATDYISLKDCTASGKINFFAGSHSTNVSGNTNWNFTDVYIDMPGSPKTMNMRQAVNRAGTY